MGRWLREHRERLGLSQGALARRLLQLGIRVDQSILSRWENGKTRIPSTALADLGRAIGASLDSLAETVTRARTQAALTPSLEGRTVEELIAEGDRLARRGRFHRALLLYEAAEDTARLLDEPLAPDDEGDLQLRIAQVARRLWFLDRCRFALQRVGVLADRVSFSIRLRGLLLRVTLEQRAGDPLAAALFAREARAKLRLAKGRLRTWGLHVLGHYEFVEERYEQAIPFLDSAATGWDRLGDRLQHARALAFLGYATARRGAMEEGESLLQQALEESREEKGMEVEALAMLELGRVRAENGDVEGGLELLSGAAALAARLDLPELRFIANWHGWRCAPAGAVREKFARRLRRLAHRVSPLLPEHRAWVSRQRKEVAR